MKTITGTIFLSAVPLFVCVSGCEAETRCPLGEEPVRVAVGTYNERWVCSARSTYPTNKPPSTSGAPDASTASSAPASPSVESDGGAPSSPPSAPPGTCGAVDSKSDVVRIVEKAEAAPAYPEGGAKPVDGHYALVQASFYRTETGPVGVDRLQAGIDIRGSSIGIGAQNVSQVGEESESMTFLLADGGITKVCETRHGTVAQWLFPIATGSTGHARFAYDSLTSTLRLVVSRPEGETELIFSR